MENAVELHNKKSGDLGKIPFLICFAWVPRLYIHGMHLLIDWVVYLREQPIWDFIRNHNKELPHVQRRIFPCIFYTSKDENEPRANSTSYLERTGMGISSKNNIPLGTIQSFFEPGGGPDYQTLCSCRTVTGGVHKQELYLLRNSEHNTQTFNSLLSCNLRI